MDASTLGILLLGIVGTWVGAEFLVRGAARIALGLGVRPLVVGLTIVAFGTSSPEAVASLLAVIRGSGGLALGNVLGSNIANIGLILAILALLRPLPVHWTSIRVDVGIMVGATLMSLVLMYWGRWVGRMDGAVLLIGMVGYLVYYLRTGHEPAHPERVLEAARSHGERARELGPPLLLSVLGLALLIAGASMLVNSATAIAAAMGIPEAVIGATMVAVGTSLPELAASAVAVVRGHAEIGVGNIVGSNVLNLLFVLGSVGVVRGVPVDDRSATLLIPVMVGYTLLIIPLMRSRDRLGRVEGVVLLLGYLLFAWRAYVS